MASDAPADVDTWLALGALAALARQQCPEDRSRHQSNGICQWATREPLSEFATRDAAAWRSRSALRFSPCGLEAVRSPDWSRLGCIRHRKNERARGTWYLSRSALRAHVQRDDEHCAVHAGRGDYRSNRFRLRSLRGVALQRTSAPAALSVAFEHSVSATTGQCGGLRSRFQTAHHPSMESDAGTPTRLWDSFAGWL